VSELYDTDFVLWSEQQADRLRRLARGEQVNDLDWPNLVEEVEGLGRSATSAVRSLLLRALEHILKAAAWPQAPSARKWLHEASTFLEDASDDWTPAMAGHIDLSSVYAKALRRVRDLEFEEGVPGPLPDHCPVTLADLLAGDPKMLIDRFRPARLPG
jgi:hypothetical protein